MKLRRLLEAGILCLGLGFWAGCSHETESDFGVRVKSQDPEMRAAFAKARASLPDFWSYFNSHGNEASDFAIKVPVADKGEVEYVWLTKLARKGGALEGMVSDEMKLVKRVRLGERIPVNEPEISDWSYMRDGKLHGNFTARALLNRMPKADAEKLSSILAEN